MSEAKQFFFEKKAMPPANQKTFVTLGHGRWRLRRPKPSKKPVMPAQAGIHDFLVSGPKPLDPRAAGKSWMPAFAGMTSEKSSGGSNPSIRDSNAPGCL
jgi:hypothetical protein